MGTAESGRILKAFVRGAVRGDPTADDEELVEKAMQVLRDTRRASTSALQRRLRIGYTSAAHIMDLLEERGVVGPTRGAEPREILVELDGTAQVAATA
jgi:S-DNA-T family DNA segregation ATPase FtsK/SpoIIIE